MNAKPILIILIVIVFIFLAWLMGPMIMNSQFQKTDSQLEITSNNTLYKGDNLTVRLSDVNGTPIPDAKINISVINEAGKDEYSVVTDSNGEGYLKLDKIVGKYTVNCTFDGDWNFKPAHQMQRIEITVEKAQPVYQVLNQSFNSSMNTTLYYDGNLNIYYGNGSSMGDSNSSGSDGYIEV
jgi:hypothetical protein